MASTSGCAGHITMARWSGVIPAGPGRRPSSFRDHPSRRRLRPDAHRLSLRGDDLRRDPLAVRKTTLASLIARAAPGLRLNEHLDHDDGPLVFEHAPYANSGMCRSRAGPISRGVSRVWREYRAFGVASDVGDYFHSVTKASRIPAIMCPHIILLLTAIAKMPHRRRRNSIFGGNYPVFPLREIAVYRKVYRESARKDLDIRSSAAALASISRRTAAASAAADPI
jgi:hypothetical protein